ncbi:hypothetical protein HNP38_002669 [Chryseobacterium defluvii]|uniref:Uncharacterized protein n=1 Tax=Chryseobacterium defluvii TaxID=160396 RepID=A0A840KFI3_9FLAO|nr:hypothetical protein [Chryseobacterium defluvii]
MKTQTTKKNGSETLTFKKRVVSRYDMTTNMVLLPTLVTSISISSPA